MDVRPTSYNILYVAQHMQTIITKEEGICNYV